MTDMEGSSVFGVDRAFIVGGTGYLLVQEMAGAIMGRVYKAVECVMAPGASADAGLVPVPGDPGGVCVCVCACVRV